MTCQNNLDFQVLVDLWPGMNFGKVMNSNTACDLRIDLKLVMVQKDGSLGEAQPA